MADDETVGEWRPWEALAEIAQRGERAELARKAKLSRLSSMRRIFVVALVLLTIAVCEACAVYFPGEQAIPQTRGFQSDSRFHFTISPDDHWLVYFEQLTPEQIGTRDNEYGNLRVLDLRTGALQKLTIPENQGPRGLTHGDASWAPDSSHCILPPPAAIRASPERGILIDLRDPADIRVVTVQVQHGENRGVDVPSERYEMPAHYSCSDCSPHLNDVELIKKHVDAKYLKWGTVRMNPNCYAEQIVSPDGKRIYYQKGVQTDEVSLFERDITSGAERELASFPGDCAQIDRLRPSPDGRKLAFQLTTGCDFVGKPTVYVLDLVTSVHQTIGKASGGTMHWTSASDKLFFYRDDYLHVAEFEKPEGPQPQTQPQTQPER